MTKEELIALRTKYQLTQTGMADALGLSVRTYQGYEAGRSPVPEIVAKCAPGYLADLFGEEITRRAYLWRYGLYRHNDKNGLAFSEREYSDGGMAHNAARDLLYRICGAQKPFLWFDDNATRTAWVVAPTPAYSPAEAAEVYRALREQNAIPAPPPNITTM